ncbi:MAG TPA: ABC transporter permease [Hyphomicrobiales bacterium]|nr:ABC transporter permease [Hyphomicrobiales bacterium]
MSASARLDAITAVTQERRPARAVPLVAVGRVLIVLALLLFWQVASDRLAAQLWVSDPADIAVRLWRWTIDGTLGLHLLATIEAWGAGYVTGGLCGIAVGFLLGIARFADRVLSLFIAALYGLPKLALLPLFVIGFGIGLQSKIALVATVIFFITLYSTRDGVRDVDPDLIASLRIMGASRSEILSKLLLPATLPWILTAMRISVSITLVTTVGGEVLSSNRGLGFLIASSSARFDTTGVFAAATVLVAISAVVNALLTGREAGASRWRG